MGKEICLKINFYAAFRGRLLFMHYVFINKQLMHTLEYFNLTLKDLLSHKNAKKNQGNDYR